MEVAEVDNDNKDFHMNFPTKTIATDDEKVLDNFGKGQLDGDNIQVIANLHDSQCDVCNNVDPMEQMAEVVEVPKMETFDGYCMNSKNSLSQVYQKSKVFRLNLFHAMNVCCVILSHVHVGLIDFYFSDDDQDSQLDLSPPVVAVFPTKM
jgi:hypothetical protein